MKKIISIFLVCILMVGLCNVPVFALTKPGNGSDQPNGKFQSAKFHLTGKGMVHPDEIIEEGKKFAYNIAGGKIDITGIPQTGMLNEDGFDSSVILKEPPNLNKDVKEGDTVVWYYIVKEQNNWHVYGYVIPGEKEEPEKPSAPEKPSVPEAPSAPAEETVNIRIDTAKKMAVRFEDGKIYYDGNIKTVVVGKEYYFQMCSVNWENGIYDDNGNGLAGSVVYTFKAVHRDEFNKLREEALKNPERYTVKGIDIIDNDAKTIIVNCDASDFHLETDVNNFFVAYRFHFAKGDYNKQTGIENVVETPLESLSVNLPVGPTVKCDAYKAYKEIDTDNIFITRNNNEGKYADVYLASVNDYTWNH